MQKGAYPSQRGSPPSSKRALILPSTNSGDSSMMPRTVPSSSSWRNWRRQKASMANMGVEEEELDDMVAKGRWTERTNEREAKASTGRKMTKEQGERGNKSL